MSILSLSAHQLLSAYRERSLSPVDVLQAVFRQVEALNPKINAFCEMDVEGALQSAKASEARWHKGSPCGALDGVPVSIKDMIPTLGMSTRFGSRTLPEGHLRHVDAPSVAMLRNAGALIFGKTTTSEFGNKIVTDSPLTGSTRNPWDLRMSAGGSSGGAGAAIAAGMGPLALATDGGGSVRVPACWNGVFGLKPSFKRIPTGDVENVFELASLGPMSRTVRDAALAMNVVARPWAGDWQVHSGGQTDFLENLDAGVRGLKIAYSVDLGIVDVEPEIAAAVEEASRAFASLGAEVLRLDDLPPLQGYMQSNMHSLQWFARCDSIIRRTDASLRPLMDPDLLQMAEVGAQLRAGQLVDASRARLELTRGMHALLSDFDLLISPTFHRGPPTVPGLPDDLQSAPPLTSWCNQTQQPAATIPCGMTAAGLPIGLQVVAARFRDDLVLQACQAYETVRGPFPLAALAGIKEPS